MSESAGTLSSITRAGIPSIIEHYGLGKFKRAWRPERGFVNDNWVVQTNSGTYFLKHRHPSLSRPEFVRCQHELVGWLQQAGFPAPRLLLHAGGDTLLVLGRQCYEVQSYIDGRPYDHARPQDLTEAALTLGQYHTLVQGFSQYASRTQGDLYAPGILEQNLSSLVRDWQVERDSGLHGLASHLAAQAQDLANRFAEHGTLPQLVIHGDYYGDNLLFDAKRIVGVVDYDKASWQPRVVELAEALIYFASPRPGQLTHLVYPGVLQWESFLRFLNAYASVVPVTSDEARALPDYIHCIWLQMSLQRLLERGARPAWAVEALQELVALSDWAGSNTSRITEASHPTTREHGSAASISQGAVMIKAVIFDFGRVISAQKPWSLFRGYEDDLGLERDTINPIMFGSEAWQELLVGRITSDEYWRRIAPLLRLETPQAIEAFRQRYHEDEAINEGVVAIIERLHGRYKLAVLSNCPPGLDKWLADWEILHFFDVVVCSGDEGVVKPDRVAFDLVLTRLGVEAGEAIFIDDTMRHVRAARELGLQGMLFTTAEALEQQLQALLQCDNTERN